MKHMVMLMCIFVLLLDLSDEGQRGKAQFVAPFSPVLSLEVSFNHSSSEAPDCHNQLPHGNFQLTLHQPLRRTTGPFIQSAQKRIVNSHLSSAGGLPG